MKKIGQYTVIKELGKGGMARVYLAHDARFDREVAIKVLPREFMFDDKFLARFEREAKTIAKLEHPAIVPVYDYGEEDGQPYLVMRHMAGGSLKERMEQGVLPTDEILKIIPRVAEALHEAHQMGIVHRDLKPGNILFDASGRAYLADFGIVKLAEATANLTGSALVGTPAYMSPEQVHGDQELDGRSDVYALGIILFEMLSGKRPYEADTPAKLAFKHVLDPVPNIHKSRSDLSYELKDVTEKALAKDRDDRFATPLEFSASLKLALKSTSQPAADPDPAPELKSETPEPIATQPAPQAEIEAATLDEQTPPEPIKKKESPTTMPKQDLSGRMNVPAWVWVAFGVLISVLAVFAFVWISNNSSGSSKSTSRASRNNNENNANEVAADTSSDDDAEDIVSDDFIEEPAEEDAPDDAAEEPAEEIVPEEVAEEPAVDIADEKHSITILISGSPVSFNGLNSNYGYEQMLGELIMLSLAEVDPYGNVIPELAVEIPTIENGGVIFDQNTWTMSVVWTLRDDVYWSDGEQLTVDDVLFTWDVIAAQSWVPGVDYTESIEKVDDFTFIVHYYEGYIFPDYALQFGGEDFFVYPEHYCDAGQGFYSWDCDDAPLSSGPYILTEWRTDDYLIFSANPNYYEPGKPGIDEIIVQIVPEESVKKAMMTEGDADVHYWPTEINVVDYRSFDNITFVKAPTERWVMRLIPNQTLPGDDTEPHPFLADKRVRQAIRMAIDVDAIIDDVFLGFGEPVWTEFFRPPYNVCTPPRPEYDPAGAAALLEEAGWVDTDGDGVNECHGCLNAAEGTLMTMEFVIYAEYGETLEMAQLLIADSLESIGFDVETVTLSGWEIWAPAADGGTEENGFFELDMWDDGYPGLDPTDNLIWTYYYSQSTWNYGNWVNDDMDALIDELYTLDEGYRMDIFCEMAWLMDDELPQILLWSAIEMHSISTRLDGVLPSANDPLTWNVADWTIK